MTKQRVFEAKESVDLDYLFSNTDLDQMMVGAQKLYDKYNRLAFEKGQFVEFETEWAGYDGGTEVVVCFYRWETDKEYTKRLNEEAAKEEQKRLKKEAKKAKALEKVLADEQAERELYEKLQKKFGSL